MSRLVDQALLDNASESVDLPMAGVKEEYLKMIVEYCEHYKFDKTSSDIKRPLESKTIEGNIKNEWDRAFIQKLDRDQKTELLSAANSIECDTIFELCCAALATEFKYAEWDKLKSEFSLAEVDYKPEDAGMLMK